MVSRLTSDNFKIVSSSHTPITPLTNNKWYYRDPQGEVQGKFYSVDEIQLLFFRSFVKTLFCRSILDY